MAHIRSDGLAQRFSVFLLQERKDGVHLIFEEIVAPIAVKVCSVSCCLKSNPRTSQPDK
jgi:hypothetical protein